MILGWYDGGNFSLNKESPPHLWCNPATKILVAPIVRDLERHKARCIGTGRLFIALTNFIVSGLATTAVSKVVYACLNLSRNVDVEVCVCRGLTAKDVGYDSDELLRHEPVPFAHVLWLAASRRVGCFRSL